jgi:predicted DNA-binding transcriptional regulator YafY
MSKLEVYTRYFLIIKKLRRPTTFEELEKHLDIKSELDDKNYRISKRTFQRDLNDIRELFNFEIEFRDSSYIINDKNLDIYKERFLESLDIFNALHFTERLSDYISFEKRKPQGTEKLYDLLQAIKEKQSIHITYHKFWEDQISKRILKPLALKEFRSRWYLIATDKKDNKIKTFGLDRIEDFERSKEPFPDDKPFNIDDHYKYSFGIISPNDYPLEEVILSFTEEQGKYIKTLPLHHTQEILIDNQKELRIKLQLYITHDFKMELLSYGDQVKVIQPKSLVNDMKKMFRNALRRYEK